MAKVPGKSELQIRRVRDRDVERVRELSAQLGYPASAREMRGRLEAVIEDREAACLVVESCEEGVIGWIHVSVTPLLEVERRAEVNGLVVDERLRSRGAGAMLLAGGEKWAKGKRCKGMSVRSKVLRERAHEFYRRNGYEHYKTQKVFRKAL